MKLKELTQTAAEKAVGVPVEHWDGNCHSVSAAIAPLVGGVVRRGFYLGPTAPGAFFHNSFAQHSWIELTEGVVCDPTRHAFDLSPRWPLWVGDDAEYDIGGCRSRPPAEGPPHDLDPSKPTFELALSRDVLNRIGLGLVLPRSQWLIGGKVLLGRDQVGWLGNLPIKDQPTLGAIARDDARAVYQALVDADLGAIIPIDRRDWILGDMGAAYGREAA